MGGFGSGSVMGFKCLVESLSFKTGRELVGSAALILVLDRVVDGQEGRGGGTAGGRGVGDGGGEWRGGVAEI